MFQQVLLLLCFDCIELFLTFSSPVRCADVIGIPAVTFWVLYRRRFKLNLEGPAGNETRKTYGFIYQGYGIFYWEVVVRACILVRVVVFGRCRRSGLGPVTAL